MHSTVYAINTPNAERLEAIKAEMETLGAPTIRVFDNGDCYIALEGSHRLAAAEALGLTPIFVEMAEDDEMEHDLEDMQSNKVSDLLEYIGFGTTYYTFGD